MPPSEGCCVSSAHGTAGISQKGGDGGVAAAAVGPSKWQQQVRSAPPAHLLGLILHCGAHADLGALKGRGVPASESFPRLCKTEHLMTRLMAKEKISGTMFG